MVKSWRIIFKLYSNSTPRRHLYTSRTVAAPHYNSCSPDVRTLNNRITHFIQTNRIQDARAIFDQSNQKNIVTWNSMLTGYVKRREMTKARKLFDEMSERDVVTWNLMISGYVGSRYIEEGRYLFDKMPERDFVSWNTMISGYARNGRMDQALSLFKSMPKKNVVSWNAMISGFLHNGDVKNAIGFFEDMPERDSASLSALVSGLIRNGELDEAARILFENVRKNDGKIDLVHASNTLIAGYGQRGRIAEARRVFDGIPSDPSCKRLGDGMFKKNVVSWNTMIMCYVKAGKIDLARELFDLMTERDTFSWNTMISGYIHVSDMEEALNLFGKMPDPDVLSWNSVISGYAQRGSLRIARDLFDKMPQKNLVSWNSIIAGYEKNKNYEGGIELFMKMGLEGEKPDRHTLSSLLSICAEFVALGLGTQIHQLVRKLFIPDVPLNNSLITMYARCGAISEARSIFDEMKLQKDVVSWNAMIGGYASHGFAVEALELFNSMKKEAVSPTYITFLSVLNACANAGLVELGRMHFKSMTSDYGIKPRVEHFASLVDVLGRHGQVEEAMDIIMSMSCEPDKAVWGALLGACKMHNNVKLARVAADALMRLQPESSAPYVLLYNMFVDLEQWNHAEEIRLLMERNNIRKEAGHSRVDSSTR